MQLIAALILAASASAAPAPELPRMPRSEAEAQVMVTITRPAYIQNGNADQATRERAQVTRGANRITYEFQ